MSGDGALHCPALWRVTICPACNGASIECDECDGGLVRAPLAEQSDAPREGAPSDRFPGGAEFFAALCAESEEET